MVETEEGENDLRINMGTDGDSLSGGEVMMVRGVERSKNHMKVKPRKEKKIKNQVKEGEEKCRDAEKRGRRDTRERSGVAATPIDLFLRSARSLSSCARKIGTDGPLNTK